MNGTWLIGLKLIILSRGRDCHFSTYHVESLRSHAIRLKRSYLASLREKAAFERPTNSIVLTAGYLLIVTNRYIMALWNVCPNQRSKQYWDVGPRGWFLLECLRILHGKKIPVKSLVGICGKSVDVLWINALLTRKQMNYIVLFSSKWPVTSSYGISDAKRTI